MRLIRWVDSEGRPRWGQWLDEQRTLPLKHAPYEAIEVTDEPVTVHRRLAPVDPPNIIAIGRNYPEHAREMKAAAPAEEPLIFLKATSSIVGPGDAIVLPRSAPDEVDFEAELAVVIGRQARRVSEESALSHVLGYTCANDVTARDCQKRRDKQWARGKSFDTFCPIGPWLVTADELAPDALSIRSTLSGRIMQDGNTSDMIFNVARLISYLSHQFTLLPGTVILTGTPAGVGSARVPPVFLRPGDEISVEIDRIGRLTNPVVRE